MAKIKNRGWKMRLLSMLAKINGYELYDLSETPKYKEVVTDKEKYIMSIVNIADTTSERITSVWGESSLEDERLADAYKRAVLRGVELIIATYELKNPVLRELAKEGRIRVRKTKAREPTHLTVYDGGPFVEEFHPSMQVRRAIVSKNDTLRSFKLIKRINKIFENSDSVPPSNIDKVFPIPSPKQTYA